MDETVWSDTDLGLYVIKSDRAFGSGYNVYRRVGDTQAKKINPAMGWFSSLDAALAWIRELLSSKNVTD